MPDHLSSCITTRNDPSRSEVTASYAVIIPHFNDVTRLVRCLDALVPQLDEKTELLVVDNNSSADLSPLTAAYPDIRLVRENKKGAAEARNRGVLETTAPALFFLDCDCVPAANWLKTAQDIHGTADVVGGQISVFDETPAPRSGAEAFEAVFAFDNRVYVEAKGFSVTANLLTQRAVFEATGPFVAGLSEDLDWCRRATAAGFELRYADELQVSHPSRSDWAALCKKWRRLTEESFGVNGTQGGKARLRWLLRALLMPVSDLAHTPRVLNSQKLTGKECRRAVATLWRLRLQRASWMLRQAVQGCI